MRSARRFRNIAKANGKVDGDAALDLRLTGLRFGELARATGFTVNALHLAAARAAQRRGIKLPPSPNPTTVDGDRALALRKKGLTWPEVALKMGCTRNTAARAATREARQRREALPKVHVGRRSILDGGQALRLRRRGLTWTEIASRIGAAGRLSARMAAQRVAKKKGVAMPPPPPAKGHPPIIDGGAALRLYRRQKLNWTQIGEVLGSSPFGARLAAEREARRLRVPLPRRPKVWIDAKKAYALRRQGLTWISIAVRLGCSSSGASAAVRALYRH